MRLVTLATPKSPEACLGVVTDDGAARQIAFVADLDFDVPTLSETIGELQNTVY